MSMFVPLFGIFVAIWLFATIKEVIREFRNEAPGIQLYGSPNWVDKTEHASHTGTVTSELAYRGEPWFTQASVFSFSMKVVLVAVSIWYFEALSDDLVPVVVVWISEHQYLALAGSILCLLLALLAGAIRQVLLLMMSNALAIPMKDKNGKLFLSYLGDVPSFRWQYSPWPRFLSWVLVAVTSLIFAIVGGQLASIWLGTDPAITFWILLIIRWAVSSIPARFWMD